MLGLIGNFSQFFRILILTPPLRLFLCLCEHNSALIPNIVKYDDIQESLSDIITLISAEVAGD